MPAVQGCAGYACPGLQVPQSGSGSIKESDHLLSLFRNDALDTLYRFCLIKIYNKNTNNNVYLGNVWPLLIPLLLMQFDANIHALTWVVFVIKLHKTKTLNEILLFLDFYGVQLATCTTYRHRLEVSAHCCAHGSLKRLCLSLLWMGDPFWD